MSSQTSSGNLIANRYASALYELATESKNVDAVLKDLEFLQKGMKENKDLKLLVKSPLIASDEKQKIMEKILSKQSSNKLTTNFLKIISNNKRFIVNIVKPSSIEDSIIYYFVYCTMKSKQEH